MPKNLQSKREGEEGAQKELQEITACAWIKIGVCGPGQQAGSEDKEKEYLQN
ncbi:MAG: hypothetical protein JW937_04025 [Candidatus Omnitrophica bacterium]|nr:hypothetical protein [Candidatus Omnitrophota bacterium]